jgi:hypothetical protein
MLRAFRPRGPVAKIPATILKGEQSGESDHRPQLKRRAPWCGARPHTVRPYRRGDANALPVRTKQSRKIVSTEVAKIAKCVNVVPPQAAKIRPSLRSLRLLLMNSPSFSCNDSRTGCGNFGHGMPRGRNAHNIIFSPLSSPCFRASSEAGGESFLEKENNMIIADLSKIEGRRYPARATAEIQSGAKHGWQPTSLAAAFQWTMRSPRTSNATSDGDSPPASLETPS